jgi:DNA-binding IclR family transcriptional regulator
VVQRARPENYNLESVARMAAVLTSLEASNGGFLDEVARRANLSESTALRYLLSLSCHNLVERDAVTGRFTLGLSLFRLGNAAMSQRDMSAIAKPILERLRDEFEETVNLAARQRDRVIVMQTAESPRSLRKGSSAGDADSWHATSLGKSLLAALPDAEREEILGAIDLPRFTPNTLADPDALRHDLSAVRSRGYAIDDEESVEGLRCVGVAIADHAGIMRYALSVSGPKSRMSYARLQEIGERLVEASAHLSRELGFSE